MTEGDFSKRYVGPPEVGPEDMVIALATGTFSPTEPDLDGIRELYPGEKARVIIQTNGPALPEWIEQIEGLGVVIESYIPKYAFLATVPSDKIDDLLGLDFVRWIGPYEPEHKVRPSTASQLASSPGSVLLIVKGFAADSPEDLRRAVEDAGGVVLRELPYNGAIVSIPAAKATELADSAYVMTLDLMRQKTLVAPKPAVSGEALPPLDAKPTNYWAGQVTGAYWFRRFFGVDGFGVTIAIGDTGLDIADMPGVDDDGDGLIDEDPVEPGCWINNDGDYLINEDGPDDDGDGLIDEDPVNGADDDGDGYPDEDPVAGLDEDGDGSTDEDPINGADDDGDGLIDEDPAGVDNDWDGLVDEDPVETGPPCVDDDGDGLVNEDPAGIDNDGDGLVNEDSYDDDGDGRLNEDPMNFGDNDGDGVLDEDGMSDDAACGLMDLDGDGFWFYDDDDGDGLIDEDPVNGDDDDGDGLIDEDPIPWHDLFGTGEPHFTGDEDNDGLADEDPIDGVDNDGDGYVDEDPSGIDNDGDGLVDEDTAIWPDFAGRIKAFIDATEWWEYTGDGSAEDFWFHGTHVAESAAGTGTSMWGKYGAAGVPYYWPPIPGVAPGADLAIVRFFGDTGYPYAWEVNYDYIDEWMAYALAINSAGVSITSNSWGYPSQGIYGLEEAYWDAFVKGGEDWNGDGVPEPPVTCVFAAGNDGPDPTVSLDGPGIAKNVIQVGSVTNPPFYPPDQISDFSSRGPAADGRIKPEVVAPGEYVVGPMTGMYMYGWLTPDPVQGLHAWVSGTSMATPQVAGAAALWQSILGGLSPSATKALIVNSASWMGYDPLADSDGNGNPDLYDIGFGRVDFYDFLVYPTWSLFVCDECINIGTGWAVETTFEVTDPSVPLKVTIAWSDPPQWAPVAPDAPVLINDFDLKVIAPDGTVYMGNDLTPPYDDDRDGLNNVERVVIDSPQAGVYKIVVYAYYTPSGDPPVSLTIFGAGSLGPMSPAAPVGGVYAEPLVSTLVPVALLAVVGAGVIFWAKRKRR